MSVRNATKRARHASTTAKGPALSKLALLITTAALIIIPFAVFNNVTGFEFVQWDDTRHIMECPLYQPTPFAHLAQFWTRPYFGAYVPISCTIWAFLADQSVGSTGAPLVTFDPSKYHAANLCLHIANVLLVFFILRFFVKKDWAAALGALLFAIHPLQVEPVAWVSNLRDLLCALFSFLAILCYLYGTQREGRQWPWLVPASVCYALALLSKSAAVTLPLVLLVLDYGLNHRIPRARWGLLALWLLPAMAISLVTKYAENLEEIVSLFSIPIWQRPFDAGDTIGFYLWKLFVPHPLGVDYGRTPTWVMSHVWAYFTILVPIVLVVLAWFSRKKAVWLSAGIGIFLISVLPVSGIVPFVFQNVSTVSDRYMYFAMLGPALVFAGVLSLIPWRGAVAMGVAILVCMGYLTVRQVPVWAKTTTLFTHGLQVNPRSLTCYTFLGLEEQRTGDFYHAIPNLRAAVSLRPTYLTQYNLAQALIDEWVEGGRQAKELGLLQEAQEPLLAAIELNQHFEPVHQNLGFVSYKLGRFADSIAQYRAAIADDPNDPANYYSLSLAYSGAGDKASAHTFMAKAAMMGYPPAIQMLSPKASP